MTNCPDVQPHVSKAAVLLRPSPIGIWSK